MDARDRLLRGVATGLRLGRGAADRVVSTAGPHLARLLGRAEPSAAPPAPEQPAAPPSPEPEPPRAPSPASVAPHVAKRPPARKPKPKPPSAPGAKLPPRRPTS